MEIKMQSIIEHLTKKLGRPPTNDELCKALNGIGLIAIIEEIKNAS